jgi:hypothetical protein
LWTAATLGGRICEETGNLVFHIGPGRSAGMSKNPKRTSPGVASLAASTLRNHRASQIAKTLAGSVLSQAGTDNETGAELEDVASRVLHSNKYSDDTKTLAASVLSQSNNRR